MNKILLSLVALMFVAGCEEHYWDARYNIERYCSMRTTCGENDYSSCVEELMDSLASMEEDYPNCREEISHAYIAKYRNMADEDSCYDWNYKTESEYEDNALVDKAEACKDHYYPSRY